MINPTIVPIPIAEIRIVNPRSRNRVTFQSIKANIASVGLKKPITVCQRAPDEDGTRYDLVCGQGRLEAVRDLGDTMIPAIINDAPEDERYLMSLVENLARRPPSTADLLREVSVPATPRTSKLARIDLNWHRVPIVPATNRTRQPHTFLWRGQEQHEADAEAMGAAKLCDQGGDGRRSVCGMHCKDRFSRFWIFRAGRKWRAVEPKRAPGGGSAPRWSKGWRLDLY
jgi:hypothetical protein